MMWVENKWQVYTLTTKRVEISLWPHQRKNRWVCEVKARGFGCTDGKRLTELHYRVVGFLLFNATTSRQAKEEAITSAFDLLVAESELMIEEDT